MGEIKYKVNAIKKNAQKMGDDIETFSEYGSKYIGQMEARLTRYNSDFTSRMGKALDNMKDTKAPNLKILLDNYCKSLDKAADEMQNLDEGIADKMKATGNK